jgi:hypothetical protein
MRSVSADQATYREMTIQEWFALFRFRRLLYKEIVQWAAPDLFTAVPPIVWDVDLSEHLGVPADVFNTIDVNTLTLHADGTKTATQTVVGEYNAHF